MAPKQRNTAARPVSPAPTASTTSTSATPQAPRTAPAAPLPPSTATVPKSPKSTATTSTGSSSSSSAGGLGGAPSWDKIVANVAQHYLDTTPQRTKLLDSFMAFLVVVGALQFAYCVLAGNYPFNAFLSGFAATVGQFVLTASLRIQTTEANKKDFPEVSPERAFADYVVCSLILHFFCVNFIN